MEKKNIFSVLQTKTRLFAVLRRKFFRNLHDKTVCGKSKENLQYRANDYVM